MDKDRIDKGVNKSLAVLLLFHVQLAEAVQEESHLSCGDFRLLQLLLGYEGLEFLLGGFQFGQFGLQSLGSQTSHDGIDNIVDGSFGFPKLLLIDGQVGGLLVLHPHEHSDNGVNHIVIHQHSHGFIDNQILYPVLFDGFLLAAVQLLFGCVAFVITVNGTVTGLATFAMHGGTAMPTEQLGGQEVVFYRLGPGWGLAVLGKPVLHSVKQVLGDDGWNTVWNRNVLESVLTDITAIVQHTLNGAVIDSGAFGGGNALGFEEVQNLGDGLALVVHLESFQDNGSSIGVRLKVLVQVKGVANGQHTTIPDTLFSIEGHTPNNLYFEVFREVFCIALQDGFQQDTLCTRCNDLGCRNQFDPVLFQLVLIPCAVVTVTGKAVQLPDDDHIKKLSLAVFNHLLKLGSIVRSARNGPICIGAR